MNYGKKVETLVSDFPFISVYIITIRFLKLTLTLYKITGGVVFVKKSAHAIILLMVFPLIVTGCANNVGQATPKTQQDEKVNTVGSSNNQLEQVASPIIKITKEQAVAKAQQNLLTLLSIKTGDVKKAGLVNDVYNLKEYWDVQFEGISVNIDSVSGTVPMKTLNLNAKFKH